MLSNEIWIAAVVVAVIVVASVVLLIHFRRNYMAVRISIGLLAKH
jgi:hypothetical protein